MIVHIITKLTAEQYVVTHGLGFLNINVIVNAEPIRLNITLVGTGSGGTPPTVISASPIRLNINLLGTPVIIPGNVIHAEAIRLALRLNGAAIGGDIFILDFAANINLIPFLEATINTKLNFETKVELDEEVMRVRIT